MQAALPRDTHPHARAPTAAARTYVRHRPEDTVLYGVVQEYAEAFFARVAKQGASLPAFVHQEFERYLRCGRLEEGFVRVACTACRHEHLVAFSCKCRGICPSCGARRMVESAAGLVEHVFPHVPVRQWVLSFPWPLRLLFAARPELLTRRCMQRGLNLAGGRGKVRPLTPPLGGRGPPVSPCLWRTFAHRGAGE